MTTPSILAQQLEIAQAALQHIYEDTDDTDTRHAAEHAIVRIKRLEVEPLPAEAQE
ncbi:hypothetical protein [Pseudomonas amygdali]|uniref:Uncharacterized protein n=1 Tax=Pseudomonas amygdali pv. lachrymans TaxID=53707 RepID=A0ABR5KS56_PSEAV|nr:hypothetical protein [Pseudomonas amygdali]KPC17546.1 Uncharacterized protein AC499_0748 [Pseudomonas amygdali pv. lachrymans]RMT06546.1 hypothetical protein ALP54_102811 [Pseudomonas amygdali pv. lachrymans]